MSEQRKQPGNRPMDSGEPDQHRSRQPDPANAVRKGGTTGSDADFADVSRDTYGEPLGEGGTGTVGPTTASPDMRPGAAAEADEALTEALEQAKADKEPAQQTGNRGRDAEESEAAGE